MRIIDAVLAGTGCRENGRPENDPVEAVVRDRMLAAAAGFHEFSLDKHVEDAGIEDDARRGDPGSIDGKFYGLMLRPRTVEIGRRGVKDVPGFALHRAAGSEDVPEFTIKDRTRVFEVLRESRMEEGKYVLTERDGHLDLSEHRHPSSGPAKPLLVVSLQAVPATMISVLSIPSFDEHILNAECVHL